MRLYFKYLCFTLIAILCSTIFIAHIGPESPPKAGIGSTWNTCAAAGYPTRFDDTIRAAVAKHWPLTWQPYHCDWRAQLARESSLSTASCAAANHAGAKCLAQILPGTAKDIEAATGLLSTRSDAHAAIMGGAWYMSHLGDAWIEPRPVPCQMDLARAGYISGNGHIHRAQRAARKQGLIARCFDDGISEYLDAVISASNAQDVRNYISSINALSIKMR